MRITYVAQELTVGAGEMAGGSQRSLHKVASRISEKGYDVTVLTLNSKNNHIKSSVPYNVEEATQAFPYPPERIDSTLPSILSSHDDTDIFHVFGPRFVPGAGRYRVNSEVPVVARLNSYGVFCYNMSLMDGECHKECNLFKRFKHYDGSVGKSIRRVPLMAYADVRLRWFENIDRLFAQSPAVQDIYENIGIKTPPIKVVPNFIESDFSDIDPKTDIFDNEKFNVIVVGRLVPEKGVGDILETAKMLREGIDIHIIGDGPLLDSVEIQSRELDNVICHGFIQHDKIPAYYAAADLYVHSGTWPDPCPRTVLEAMAAGTPLLVTDIGGPPWMAGKACKRVPPADAASLEQAIEELAESRDELERLESATGRELERFRPNHVISRYTSVYDSLG